MEVKELRIGNLLQWRNNNAECEVTPSLFQNTYFWGHIEAKDIEPIPLTKEWLLKCGFEGRELSLDIVNIGFMEADVDTERVWIGLSVGKYVEECNLLPDLHYVHQLQNLYFALTGQELELKTLSLLPKNLLS